MQNNFSKRLDMGRFDWEISRKSKKCPEFFFRFVEKTDKNEKEKILTCIDCVNLI